MATYGTTSADDPQRKVIAIAYDFDGTLSPQPMQEYTVLPALNLTPGDFWEEVNRQAQADHAEKMLTYMRLLLEKSKAKGLPLTRKHFHAMGGKIDYFPGVESCDGQESWFHRINDFVRNESRGTIETRHYIISAGLLELLEGTRIVQAGHFARVYASEYHYDEYKSPSFPKVLVTDTTKTQYLFRINKGREDINQNINEHMPEKRRPIPFSNILYVGDGETDIPSMTVTRDNGGHALAVYREKKADAGKTFETCRRLLKDDRVDLIAPADFRAASVLENRMRQLLRTVCQDMLWQEQRRACRHETYSGGA